MVCAIGNFSIGGDDIECEIEKGLDGKRSSKKSEDRLEIGEQESSNSGEVEGGE